jgi:hypothetical protein
MEKMGYVFSMFLKIEDTDIDDLLRESDILQYIFGEKNDFSLLYFIPSLIGT